MDRLKAIQTVEVEKPGVRVYKHWSPEEVAALIQRIRDGARPAALTKALRKAGTNLNLYTAVGAWALYNCECYRKHLPKRQSK